MTDDEIYFAYQKLWPFHPAEEPKLAKDITVFAHAIIAAHTAKLRQGEPVAGWKLVPVEPTQAMVDAVKRAYPDNRFTRDSYRAMLAAVPAAQPDAVKQIAEALRRHGLTLVKTTQGYDVMKLGQITAQAAPAAKPTCKQDLPVETEQERYVRLCPDIECGRKKKCTRIVGVSCMSRADIGDHGIGADK